MVGILDGPSCIILWNHDLMKFLAGSYSYNIRFAFRGDYFCQIHDIHAGQLGYEKFSTNHCFQVAQYELDALFHGNPEAGHSRVGNGQNSCLPALHEKGNNAATTARHISISYHAEDCAVPAYVGIAGNEELVGTKFSGAI